MPMKTNEGFRHHARFAVSWPVTYWNENVLFGQGTVLDISHVAGRLAGTMPVAVGMVLKVRIAPPQRENPLYVHEGRVLWAKGCKFGVELRGLSSTDHRWLIGFLQNAERRNSFRQVTQAPTIEDLAAVPLALPLKE
jgi:PilZ domain-containing protein